MRRKMGTRKKASSGSNVTQLNKQSLYTNARSGIEGFVLLNI